MISRQLFSTTSRSPLTVTQVLAGSRSPCARTDTPRNAVDIQQTSLFTLILHLCQRRATTSTFCLSRLSPRHLADTYELSLSSPNLEDTRLLHTRLRQHLRQTPAMEAAHYPPNGGPHAGAPSYNGPLSMNDPSYRREQYSQQTMTGQQGYNMSPPAPPQVTSSQAHGQPSYQPPQQLQNTQPPQNPQQGNTQSGQQFNPEVKQEEDQGGQGAMIGQTPDGTGPNALLPLVSNSMGTAPKGPQEIPPSFSMIELGRRYTYVSSPTR